MPNIEKMCFNCFREIDHPGLCPYCGFDNTDNTIKFPGSMKAGSILNGQYIVGRVLGQGGFGITYLALDYHLDIRVAIKEYLPEGMATRLLGTTLVTIYEGEKLENFNYGAERFLDEARVLAKFIGIKSIASIKSYFRENNTAYFVMDYIEGINFKNYIKNHGGTINYQEALRILLPVMDALAIVHQEGVIHRDVTPDNIYITKDNEIKLLDFGSARYSLGDKSKCLDIILKAGYAPKEQYIRKGKQGPYTDIYSVAACFYASITGYLPPEALERIENDEILSISMRGIEIPMNMDFAIMKGLALRAEDRFQTMEDFKAKLLEVPEIAPAINLQLSAPLSNNTFPTTSVSTSSNTSMQTISSVLNTNLSINPIPSRNGSIPVPNQNDSNIEVKEKQNIINLENSKISQSDFVLPTTSSAINRKEIDQNAPLGDHESLTKKNIVFQFLNNRKNLILSMIACILIVIIGIGVSKIITYRNQAISSNLVTERGVDQGSKGNDNHPNDVISDDQQIKDESIELIIDYNLNDFGTTIQESSDKMSISIEVKQASSVEEFSLITKANISANQRSISMGYFTKEVLDEAKSSGTIVKKSTYLEEVYFIACGMDENTSNNVIQELMPVEEIIAKQMESKKAAAEEEEAKKTEEIEKAEEEKAEAEKEEAEKAEAEKEAAKKAEAEKEAAKKAEAEKANICQYCDGTGKVECTWCDGTGTCKIAHWSEDGDEYIYEGNDCPKVTTCTWCNGTGKNSDK